MDIILQTLSKYVNINFDDIKKLAIITILILFLIFIYFIKSIDYFKCNLIKWDNVAFIRYTIIMLIPIIAMFLMQLTLSNLILTNWLNFVLILFILPIIPYVLLVAYRLTYLLVYHSSIKIFNIFKHNKVQN